MSFAPHGAAPGAAALAGADTHVPNSAAPANLAGRSAAHGASATLFPILEARGLSLSYGSGAGKSLVVKGVDLALEQGESFGLIGETGCGKSTILRVLSGLNPNFEGSLYLDGAPLTPPRQKAQAKRIQMVFQDPYRSLHPRHLVQTALAEPLKIHGMDRIDARIDDVLEAVGLSRAFRLRYPHELSGGQRQRVAIARALITEAEIMLLDEPTSALDVSVQAEILNLLSALRRERGLTYLLVSHDLAVVAHLCPRIAVMHEGRLVEHLTDKDARALRASHPYTRTLFEASLL